MDVDVRDEFNSGVKLSSMVSADRFTTPFEALIVIVDRLMLEVIGPSCSRSMLLELLVGAADAECRSPLLHPRSINLRFRSVPSGNSLQGSRSIMYLFLCM
jgi:hypothetical protein